MPYVWYENDRVQLLKMLGMTSVLLWSDGKHSFLPPYTRRNQQFTCHVYSMFMVCVYPVFENFYVFSNNNILCISVKNIPCI